VLAATVASASLAIGADTGDLPFFVHAADDLFTGAWADAYANPDLQVGPLQLFLLALADAAAGALSVSTFTLLAFAVPLCVSILLLVVLRGVLAGRPDRRRLVLVAAGLVAVAEVAYWALEPRPVGAATRTVVRRVLTLVLLAAVSAAAAAFVVGASRLDTRGGLALEAVGAAAIVGAIGVLAVLARGLVPR
jgi:hypothetical protein